MNHMYLKTRLTLLPLLAALLLAGCATSASVNPASLPLAPAAFKEVAASVAGAPVAPQPEGRWWTVFADPVLDQLVEQASRSNNSVQVAAARLAQARAIAGATDASRAVQLGLGAGAVRQKNSTTGNLPQTAITAHANLSYELDLFGKLAGASNAATLDAQSREALLRSTQLLVQADIDAGLLVNICPVFARPIALYWHCWNLQSDVLDALSKALQASALQDLQGGDAPKKSSKS